MALIQILGTVYDWLQGFPAPRSLMKWLLTQKYCKSLEMLVSFPCVKIAGALKSTFGIQHYKSPLTTKIMRKSNSAKLHQHCETCLLSSLPSCQHTVPPGMERGTSLSPWHMAQHIKFTQVNAIAKPFQLLRGQSSMHMLLHAFCWWILMCHVPGSSSLSIPAISTAWGQPKTLWLLSWKISAIRGVLRKYCSSQIISPKNLF